MLSGHAGHFDTTKWVTSEFWLSKVRHKYVVKIKCDTAQATNILGPHKTVSFSE